MQPTTVARGATHAGGSSGARRLDPTLKPSRSRGIAAFAMVSILTLGLAGMWSFIAQQQLESSLVTESQQHLNSAHKAFSYARARVQAELQAHCRVMVEDPRLKSTLATEGMDVATVADILQDLSKLRGAGFLMTL